MCPAACWLQAPRSIPVKPSATCSNPGNTITQLHSRICSQCPSHEHHQAAFAPTARSRMITARRTMKRTGLFAKSICSFLRCIHVPERRAAGMKLCTDHSHSASKRLSGAIGKIPACLSDNSTAMKLRLYIQVGLDEQVQDVFNAHLQRLCLCSPICRHGYDIYGWLSNTGDLPHSHLTNFSIR